MTTTAARLIQIGSEGQVTLPDEALQQLGVKAGDVVAVKSTEQGILITDRETALIQALDEIGDALREAGVTLEEMIEIGREERTRLLRELYGIDASE